MKQVQYETFPGAKVTDDMLAEAANLFSENYGIWGEQSLTPGKRIRLGKRRLRDQYLPDHAATSYVRVTVDGTLAGNAFICRWRHDDRSICWITQLVVHRNYRGRGLASGLLGSLLMHPDDVYGIMSSHPFACLAAARSLGMGIEKVPLNFIKDNAEAILKASPVPYIGEAKLRGTLFEGSSSTGLVCGVDTGFFVDHKEPLEALEIVRETRQWPLGNLLDGHEYLLVLQSKHRFRSATSTS
ncbi:predicted protein [Uncinocarpus reesii 1704]|uniref:N-acetyltransferase domain-containing protein n=1 Tax=Uncinocarpus reesii (strain UAMH 1704) TaxID=336963 RepID=C4JZA4_UNCRE|nr:uncharacterized protein UREG_07505 [Uncinocarpus reesii 1704]EEP82640.1 predicted protein [Uncinocarpus reesii 1704]